MDDFDASCGRWTGEVHGRGFLTRMGRRVLIQERERFSGRHIGESMIASTFDVLAEIALEPKIRAVGFPVSSGGCLIWGESDLPRTPTLEQLRYVAGGDNGPGFGSELLSASVLVGSDS